MPSTPSFPEIGSGNSIAGAVLSAKTDFRQTRPRPDPTRSNGAWPRGYPLTGTCTASHLCDDLDIVSSTVRHKGPIVLQASFNPGQTGIRAIPRFYESRIQTGMEERWCPWRSYRDLTWRRHPVVVSRPAIILSDGQASPIHLCDDPPQPSSRA